jgi:hypothetical protein
MSGFPGMGGGGNDEVENLKKKFSELKLPDEAMKRLFFRV